MKLGIAIGGVLLALLMQVPAFAEGKSCLGNSDFRSASTKCVAGADEVRGLMGSADDDGYTYELESKCKAGDNRANCQVNATCTTADGEQGEIYLIWRYDDDTGERSRVGTACLTPGEFRSLGAITPAMVKREMERLTWPRAQLEIQPPHGQTLINFDTNFFTTNTRPTTQTVVLLGQRVTIEARPSEYTWHFGDDASVTTTSPGAKYPDLDVTHDYGDPGRVEPSVDTTYTGRYRVNGDAWQDIPGTLTVEGETVALRVRSASPHLVGNPA